MALRESMPRAKTSSSTPTDLVKASETMLWKNGIRLSVSKVVGKLLLLVNDSTVRYNSSISPVYNCIAGLRRRLPLSVRGRGLFGDVTKIISFQIWECDGLESLAFVTAGQI